MLKVGVVGFERERGFGSNSVWGVWDFRNDGFVERDGK